MRFSEAYGITVTDDDDWFDTHLSIDTALFVDPALLLRAGGQWADGHAEILQHFVRCYELIAEGGGPSSLTSRAALRLLKFPEPAEFCLGYTAASTRGAGGGEKAARIMRDTISVAVAAGLQQPEHIEEIGLLAEGIGADTISDAACNILRGRFILYTQDVCRRLDVPMEKTRLSRVSVELTSGSWVASEVDLPKNPCTQGPVILVPKAVLNDLPAIYWESFISDVSNQDLRDAFNLMLASDIRKSTVATIARQNIERVRYWATQQTERPDLTHYDFGADPLGVVQWDRAPAEYAKEHPLPFVSPLNQEELSVLVESILNQYKHFIEEKGGWRLLWNSDRTEKPEDAAQLVLLGTAQIYLRATNVELDREVELGRGPVDFKVASGSSMRLIIEAKKLHNGKFWNGLEKQLVSYAVSDQSPEAWFLSIRYREGRQWDKREAELDARVAALRQAKPELLIRYIKVDARPKESASKISSHELD